jgi:hypothetical protein
MLNFRRYSSDEAREFYKEVKNRSPRERFAFLLGPPRYVSHTWPGKVNVDDTSGGKWREVSQALLGGGLKRSVAQPERM